MRVAIINWDEWVGEFSHDHEQPCRTTLDAHEAVRRLDGEKHTLVELMISNRRYLTIGGGPSTFVCYVTTKEGMYSLVIPEVTGGDGVLVVGGQQSVYPREQCLPIEMVSAAADYYVQHGEMDPELGWRRA